MEQLAPYLRIVTTCLNVFSIVVLVWGVVASAKDFFRERFSREDVDRKRRMLSENKNALGGYVLFGLEILIAADIIESIVQPSWEDILRLGAIVAIRTVISYFLNKEIRDSREDGDTGAKR